MSTLAQLEARVSQALLDVANAIFTTGLIDEALRLALHQYSEVSPLGMETVRTLPGAGREIALSSVSGFVAATEVWWPYATTGSEVWPPNRVRGFRVWWDDGSPVLFLDVVPGSQPQTSDSLRLWYTKRHTIQNLDSGDATTMLFEHESMLVLGAAGYACLARSVDLNETAANQAVSTPNYGAQASMYLNEFRAWLALVRANPQSRGGDIFGSGWRLDKWDL